MLVRLAPNHMRKESDGARINHLNIFSLDRLSSNNNFEGGLSTTLGFDYEIKDENSDKLFNLEVGQIINEKENKNMPASSSLDEKLSDVVGNMNFEINKKINLNYNFAVDQNYNDLNYNEIATGFDFNPVKFNVSYLQEKEHIGNKEYMKANINFAKGNNSVFTAESKRNLITNSAEYYNLSYEYLNDCLRAGLVYRREFYEDSELEAENSLMFKITFIPFGNVNVYSDTCNIIANYFNGVNSNVAAFNFFNLDFPVNYRNNFVNGNSFYYLLAPTAKGTNQFINNVYKDRKHFWNLAYCPSSGLFNFSDITVLHLNNGGDNQTRFYNPHAGGNSANYGLLPIIRNSLKAYNQSQGCSEYDPSTNDDMCTAFFLETGPAGELPSNSNPDGTGNPSLSHLNLDLTVNSVGVEGGSHAWSNYHGVGIAYNPNSGWWGPDSNYEIFEETAGNMHPGSKARITYLNLPTQIFDPANIRVKAKAVHGN